MLRITPIRNNERSLTIRFCGQLTEEYLPEIERVMHEEPTALSTISLDLAGVTFVDRAAMEFLCSARTRNIAIENCPSYVTRWIRQEGLCSRPKK